MQVRRGCILDIASLIQDMAYGGTQFGKCLHAVGQFPKTRIWRIAIAIGSEKTHHLTNSHQQALEVKQAFGRQERARSGYFLENYAQVKVVTQREFLTCLNNRQELVSFLQPTQHLIPTGRETQLRDIGGTQCTHAMALQFPPNGIKANLRLKI